MSNRNGAKKLYKAHKTWIAAGLAAATLFSVQTFGAQTVSATGAGIQATEPVADTSALVASIAENKGFIAQLGLGNAKDTVTGKSFYGDFDALNAQVGKTINTMDDLYAAYKPIAQGVKEALKAKFKAMIPAGVGSLQDGTSGRSFYGQIDYLFNSGSVAITETGVEIRVDLDEAQAVVDRAAGAKTPYQINYVDSETGQTLTSTTLTAQAGTSFAFDKYAADILAGVPDGYKINADQIDYDPSFINYKDPAVQKATKKSADTVSAARIKVTSRATLLNEGLTATAAADLAKGQAKAAAALKAENAATPYEVDYIDSETGVVLATTTLTAPAGTAFAFDKYAGTILAGVPDGYELNADRIDYDPTFVNYKDPAVFKATHKKTTTVSTAHVYVTSRAAILNEGLKETAAADLYDARATKLNEGLKETAAADLYDARATKLIEGLKETAAADLYDARATKLIEGLKETAAADLYDARATALIEGLKETAAADLYDARATALIEGLKETAAADLYNARATALIEGLKETAAADLYDARATALIEGLKETAAADLYDARATKLIERLKETAAADLYDARATALIEGLKETAAADLYDARATALIEGLKETAAADLYDARATALIEGLKETAAADLYDARATALIEGLKATAAQDLFDAKEAAAAKAAQDKQDQDAASFNEYKLDEASRLSAKIAAEKAAGYKAGYQYGETGAVLPALAGQSDAYKESFSKGYTDGVAARIKKLDDAAAAKAKAKLDYDNATFDEFKRDEASRLSAKFAKDAKTTKDTKDTKATPAVKTPDTEAAVTTTAAKTTTKTATITKALPQTGDDVNVTASAMGVVAVLGALFGLAGTSLKKRA